MILQKEIRDKAMLHGVPKTTIDKDWVLGHVIFGLFSNELLGSLLIFKGGTCLRKCYFENYRFSEDLDFTLKDPAFEITRDILEAIVQIIQRNSGIIFHIDSFSDMLFENQRVGYKAVIKYWGADHPKNQEIPPHQRWHTYVKLEFITHELMCFDTVPMDLIHPFSDRNQLNLSIPCYSLPEIICEKLRAMIQRKYTAPRDYYDTWYILSNCIHLDWDMINSKVLQKARYKSVNIETVNDFFTEKHVKTLHSHWHPSLGHHIAANDLPPVAFVINELRHELVKNLKL